VGTVSTLEAGWIIGSLVTLVVVLFNYAYTAGDLTFVIDQEEEGVNITRTKMHQARENLRRERERVVMVLAVLGIGVIAATLPPRMVEFNWTQPAISVSMFTILGTLASSSIRDALSRFRLLEMLSRERNERNQAKAEEIRTAVDDAVHALTNGHAPVHLTDTIAEVKHDRRRIVKRYEVP
jgi:hypothetical protein